MVLFVFSIQNLSKKALKGPFEFFRSHWENLGSSDLTHLKLGYDSNNFVKDNNSTYILLIMSPYIKGVMGFFTTFGILHSLKLGSQDPESPTSTALFTTYCCMGSLSDRHVCLLSTFHFFFILTQVNSLNDRLIPTFAQHITSVWSEYLFILATLFSKRSAH